MFINIPISMLVARKLGVDGQGVYAAAGAFPALWATAWILGLDAAHTWALASNRTSLGRVFGNTILWTVGLSLVSVPTYLWAARILDPVKVRSLLPVLGLTSLIIPIVLARFLCLSAFLGLGQIDRYNVLNVISQVILLISLIGVLVVGDGGTREAILAYAFSSLLLVILAVIWMERRRGRGDPIRADRALAKTSLSYGLRGYGSTVFGQLNYRFDQVLVTQFSGTMEQGYYSIAVLMAEKLSHITNSIQLVLFPRVSASTAEDANRITTTACRHAVFWVGAGGVALFLLSRFLVRILYGNAFLPALVPLAWLIPGIFLLSYWKILTVDLSGRNRRFPVTLASGVAAVVNTALNFLWIPRHGMLGAAWSSTISYGLQSLIVAVIFLRITGVPARLLFVPQRGDLEIYFRMIRRIRARFAT
jgi:O-antigen/teichoic acid export membrane protein